MPVPQQIQDKLNEVQVDADAVGECVQLDQATDVALATAQTNKQSTAAAVGAAREHLATDLKALIDLENQTWGQARG